MIEERFIRALLRLGSFGYQEAFIVNGTKDCYVLPEDIVEDILSLSTLAVGADRPSAFGPSQIMSISSMAKTVAFEASDLFGSGSINSTDLIRDHEGWLRMRRAAVTCLRDLGISIEQYAPNEIDTARLP